MDLLPTMPITLNDFKSLNINQLNFLGWLMGTQCNSIAIFNKFKSYTTKIKSITMKELHEVCTSNRSCIPTHYDMMLYVCRYNHKLSSIPYNEPNESYGYRYIDCINWGSISRDDINIWIYNNHSHLDTLYSNLTSLVTSNELDAITIHLNLTFKYHAPSSLNDNEEEPRPPILVNGKLIKTTWSSRKLAQVSYQIGDYIITTPPYGITGVWPDHYITSYDNMHISKYSKIMHDINYPDVKNKICRNLGHLLSLPQNQHIKVILSSYPKFNLIDDILNLPHIITHLVRDLYDLTRDGDYLNLTPGKREALHKYIKDHPQILIRTLPQHQYYIEDYIVDWNCVPSHFTSQWIYKRVENPYIYITDLEILETIHSSYDYDFTITYKLDDDEYNCKQLSTYLYECDLKHPEFMPQHLNRKDIQQNCKYIKAYILGVMGIKWRDEFDDIDIEIIYNYVDILDVGGIGHNCEDSNPMSLEFSRSITDDDALLDLLDIPLCDLHIILERGYVYPLPLEETSDINEVKRAEVWSHLRLEHKTVYMNIIQSNSLSYTGTEFISNNILCDSKFSMLIENWIPDDIQSCYDVANSVGMMICTEFSVREYITNNLHLYFGEYRKPDMELYEQSGFFTGHTSRQNLLGLLKYQDSKHDDSIFLTPYEKLNSEYLITYKSDIRYITYRVIELIESFEHSTQFQLPDHNGSFVITHNEAKQLRILCLMMESFAVNRGDMDCTNFDQYIQLASIIDDKLFINSYDIAVKQQFDKLNIEDQDMIMECLSDIFYIGLNFRQWIASSSHPLPYSKCSSCFDDYDEDRDTLQTRSKFIYDFKQLSLISANLFLSLKVVNHDKHIIQGDTQFQVLWHSIIGEEQEFDMTSECVDLDYFDSIYISSKLIGTGYYYSLLFRNHQIHSEYKPYLLKQLQFEEGVIL